MRPITTSLPTTLFALFLVCRPLAHGQTIQWLPLPIATSPPAATILTADPSGANASGTWVVTNLGCYGRVLITQTYPVDVSDFMNGNFENVPNALGGFTNVQTGFGPYSWGYRGGLNFYDSSGTRDNYQVNFYFLDGTPAFASVVLGVDGLAESTLVTVSQPVVFRGEYDLASSAHTCITNQPYDAYTMAAGSTNAGTIGTIIGSYYNIDKWGDFVNTGIGLFQPANNLLTTSLPSGSSGFPPPATVPYLSLAVDQMAGDGIGFSLGYICPSNKCSNGCITIYNPNDITVTTCSNCAVVDFTSQAVDTCCTTGVVLGSTPPSGHCFPLGTNTVLVTASDACGNSNSCGFTVTVLQDTNCMSNCLQIQCPSNIVVNACTNVQVFYSPVVSDLCCTNTAVLVAAGHDNNGPVSLASAELYDPGAGVWSYTGSLATPREVPTATLLADGRVLVAGGYNEQGLGWLSSAELYDPATGTWMPTGSMAAPRQAGTATLLPSGRVLVAGGGSTGSTLLSSAELYNPASGTWSLTGPLHTARGDDTATLLPNGQVLVAGGANSGGALASAELYDPATGAWTSTGSLNVGRYNHTATLLSNGKVLVAGGINPASNPVTVSSAELYDPGTRVWTMTGSMTLPRYNHSAVVLNNGQVLVAGGTSATSELYNPVSGTWTATGAMPVNGAQTGGVLLPNGMAMVEGGATSVAISATQLYHPATGSWTTTGPLNTARFYHTATLLQNWQATCSPPSGSYFSPGTTTTVTCEARDSCGNSNSCTFTVTVLQSTNVQVQGPNNILVYSCSNVPVSYPQPTVTNLCCGTNWSVVFNPPSGTSFAPGTGTPVSWSVYDCSGTNLVSSGSFWVSVFCTNCCPNCVEPPYSYSYSVNVFSGSNYLADWLCQGTNNTLADVLPGVPDGTKVYFWNKTLQVFMTPPDTFTSGQWQNGTEPLFPGEGFLLVSSVDTNLTIYGCLPGCPGGCTTLNCASGIWFGGGTGLSPIPFADLFCAPIPPGTEVLEPTGVSPGLNTYTYNGSWSPSLPPDLPVGYAEFVKVDNSSPVINCPSDITTNSCTPVQVYYTVTASNAFGSTLTPTVTPVSGSTFEPGKTTPVNCVVTNGCGEIARCSFNVTVVCTNTGPIIIVPTVNGSNLTLSWSAQYTGWRLLVQTGHLSSGFSVNTNDWGTVNGSTLTNQIRLLIDRAVTAEFYRLRYP